MQKEKGKKIPREQKIFLIYKNCTQLRFHFLCYDILQN